MNWDPHITVACIVEKDGKFLTILEESDGKTVYNQPAGHVETSETLIEAAIRETQEETGWKVLPNELLGLYVYTSPHNQVTYYRTCFIAQAIEHNPKQMLDDGIMDVLWLTADDLKAKKDKLRSPIVYKSVEDYLNGQRFPLDFIYEHNS